MLGLGSNKFDPNADIPDLSGRTYMVTGGSAGIGFGIVAHLLQHNCSNLYLLGKKEEHIREAEEGLKQFGNLSSVHSVQIELEDFHNVDRVARDLASQLERLDGLICNAGLGVGVYSMTKDGLDSHMQVNHFSQFHLVMTLLPLLRKTPDSRLVVQSSDLHRGISDVQFASIEEMNTDIGAMKLYNRTKLAQVLFIKGLADRKMKSELGFDASQSVGPWMNATHPGGVSTDQQKQAVDAYGKLGKVGVAVVKPLMKDPVDEGCRPALFAATHGDVVKEKIQGQYVVPDRKVTSTSKEAQDAKLQENLWKLSEQVLMEKLGKLPYQTAYSQTARDGV